uniref:C2H2-type domain-containing protein n=1 Tax=Tetraodon nigroviridis TaxID=99883 RepID=H3D289_TETNG
TLTCELCDEELLVEDMKTHFLLNHPDNDMYCPLCSLSGVSFDQLCSHISSAHPDKRAVTPSSARLVSPHHERAEKVPGYGSRTTAGARNTREGEPARAPSDLTTRNTEPRWDFSREDDGDAENPSKLSLFKNFDLAKVHGADTQVNLACPVCWLVCSSRSSLQEHVDLHLPEELQADGGPSWLCPVCWLACGDSVSLQEHVDLHLDHRAAADASGRPGLDLELARQLQEEENQRRRLEETKQEKEEFKKLQRQFGVDGGGGYCRQMERAMEGAVTKGLMSPEEFHRRKADLMETLASGLDDGTTRTPTGVVRSLWDYYQAENADGVQVWLSADADHFCSSAGDRGWGCGYRNFQMLLSALHRIEAYACVLQEKTVPSIPQLQSMVEGAWKEGLDPQGAAHFHQRLLGTRAWIGATEIFSLLTFLGINSRIVDFHRATGAGHTHPLLFDWVRRYFSQAGGAGQLPRRLSRTSLPPLYLQHHGTVAGRHLQPVALAAQGRGGGLCLLLLDPASSRSHAQRLRSRSGASAAVRSIRKFPRSLKHQQYQLVVPQGVLSAQERQIKITDSQTLCAEKIP